MGRVDVHLRAFVPSTRLPVYCGPTGDHGASGAVRIADAWHSPFSWACVRDLEVGASRVAGHDDCLPTTGQVGALLWAQDTTGLPCSASSCPQHANDAWPFLTLCQFVLSISTELRGLPSSARHLDCFTDSLSLPNSRSGTTRSSHWQPLVEMGGLFAAEAVRLHASSV
jgi:hypothetical protein